jgi:hypothetical protein
VIGAVRWVAVTVPAFALVGGMLHFPGSPDDAGWESGGFGFVFGAVTGLLIGSVQLLALRGLLPRPSRWLIATAIGLGVTHGLGDGLPSSAGYLPVALGGLVTGTLQAAVLRRRWWLVATAAAFVVGILGGHAIIAAANVPNDLPADWTRRHTIVALATGIAYAAFTAPLFVERTWAATRPPA